MQETSGIRHSLELLNEFFSSRGIEFWLEAGTALAAYRDGKIFPWEHDIDIAIWKENLPNLDELYSFFLSHNYEVIFQKSLPFIDNIIQLKVSDKNYSNAIDIDIYLYSRREDFAYMRWIQKPEGFFRAAKKMTLIILRNLINPQNDKWKKRSHFFPKIFIKGIFNLYIKFHISTSSCIFHRFPKRFFEELKEINFYGVAVKIPMDTNNFLIHRYGENWRTPDSQFNESGKWKNSDARVLLPMSVLPIPRIDNNLIKYN